MGWNHQFSVHGETAILPPQILAHFYVGGDVRGDRGDMEPILLQVLNDQLEDPVFLNERFSSSIRIPRTEKLFSDSSDFRNLEKSLRLYCFYLVCSPRCSRFQQTFLPTSELGGLPFALGIVEKHPQRWMVRLKRKVTSQEEFLPVLTC